MKGGCSIITDGAAARIRQASHYCVLTAIALAMMAPFLYLVVASFVRGNPMSLLRGHWSVPTLTFYRSVWETFAGMHLFSNTAIICAAGLALELLVASLAAYPLARMEFRGKSWVFALMLSTLMLPVQASMIVNFKTVCALGLFDTYAAVVAPSAVSVFGIFLMRQAYLTIPRELDEAARIDGAGDFTIWWRIMVPLSRPALGTLTIFTFVSYWNTFIWPLVVLKHQDRYPLAVGLQFMSEVFDSSFAKIAAGSVLSMIPIVVVFLLMQRQFIKGITSGAVK